MFTGLRLSVILGVFFLKWQRIHHYLLILVGYMGLVKHMQQLMGDMEHMHKAIGGMIAVIASN